MEQTDLSGGTVTVVIVYLKVAIKKIPQVTLNKLIINKNKNKCLELTLKKKSICEEQTSQATEPVFASYFSTYSTTV